MSFEQRRGGLEVWVTEACRVEVHMLYCPLIGCRAKELQRGRGVDQRLGAKMYVQGRPSSTGLPTLPICNRSSVMESSWCTPGK